MLLTAPKPFLIATKHQLMKQDQSMWEHKNNSKP